MGKGITGPRRRNSTFATALSANQNSFKPNEPITQILEPMSGYSWRIPPEDSPATRCGYCEQPFPSTERLALHKGLAHTEQLTVAERDSYENARQEERETLRLIRLKALLALCLLYFSIPIVYALFA
jgi:hypothetical protein